MTGPTLTRRSPTRDCRDGTWIEWGPRRVEPRRSVHRLRAEWWRMTASYRETW